MNHNLFETASTKDNSVRINRLVSVILNGVVVSKLATNNGHDVNAMTESLLATLPHTVERNIRSQEFLQVKNSLSAEISQRMSATQN